MKMERRAKAGFSGSTPFNPLVEDTKAREDYRQNENERTTVFNEDFQGL